MHPDAANTVVAQRSRLPAHAACGTMIAEEATVGANLRNRSFLKELDFTPDELRFLLKLAADLKSAKNGGYERPTLDGQEHRADLREDLDPDARRLRGRRARPGGARHLPRPDRLADRPQGVDRGHGAGARPDLRRHRVPRLRPGRRRDPGPVRRRAGLERAHQRVAPDPDTLRRPHDARARAQAARRASPTPTSATPRSTWATRCWSWGA